MIKIEKVIDILQEFLEDFGYDLNHSYVFTQKAAGLGEKHIILNHSVYQDSLMIEPQVAVTYHKLEFILSKYLNRSRSAGSLQLSHWEYLNSLIAPDEKRDFIESEDELTDWKDKVEDRLVRKGFYWLDEKIQVPSLMKALEESFLSKRIGNPKNSVYLLCRLLILKHLAGYSLTDENFYSYLEILAERKTPPQQIEIVKSLKLDLF